MEWAREKDPKNGLRGLNYNVYSLLRLVQILRDNDEYSDDLLDNIFKMLKDKYDNPNYRRPTNKDVGTKYTGWYSLALFLVALVDNEKINKR